MADSKYGLSAIYYPYEVAKVRLPLGLPAGQDILKHSLFSSDSFTSVGGSNICLQALLLEMN